MVVLSLYSFARWTPIYLIFKVILVSIFAILNQLGMAYALDAFPGAVGHGNLTQGGRGGKILFVTNLDDSGPGSFRSCVETPGTRNCVFRVSGIIRLKTPIGIRTENSNLSILGQTAPGAGIILTIDPQTSSPIKTPFYIKNAHDVLVRHLRVRLQYPNSVKNADAFTIENSRRVYIDHVSGSWSTDEVISTYRDSTDVTIGYSILAEGLMPHSKCALLGSDPTQPQNISFWRNACISNNDRNPDNNHFKGSCIEIANNVFFNAKSEWAEVFSQFKGGTPISFIGNYFKAGKNTVESTNAIEWKKNESIDSPTIHEAGNVTWAPKSKHIALIAPETVQHLVPKPPCPLAVPIETAEAAYNDVQVNSGAFPRDEVDLRVMSELGSIGSGGTGSIKKEPGTMPVIAENYKFYADHDDDGIADVKEALFGGNERIFDAWSNFGKDGWTNFDAFMQWLSEERIAGRYPK